MPKDDTVLIFLCWMGDEIQYIFLICFQQVAVTDLYGATVKHSLTLTGNLILFQVVNVFHKKFLEIHA